MKRVLCWHLATVWINIDRERASPSKRHHQYIKFKLKVKQKVDKKVFGETEFIPLFPSPHPELILYQFASQST